MTLPADVPAARPSARRLFFGDDGLRAGWSLLIFFALAALFVFALGRLAHFTHLLPPASPRAAHPAEPLPGTTAIGEAIGLFGFVLAALVMSRIERRPFTRYGLARTHLLTDFLAGLAWGLALLSALVATLYLTHHLAFDSILLHGTPAVLSGLKWAVVFFLVGLQEEFITRGYLQYTVSRGVAGVARALDPHFAHAHATGFWLAALLFSVLLFMAGHLSNSGENVAGILAVGLAGTTFAFSLWRTGSLWWAIGFHAAWDWAQSFFYGVPDSGILTAGRLLATHPTGRPLLSGGPAGPEGSLFVLPTLLLACLVIHLTLPRRVYALTPDQSPPSAT